MGARKSALTIVGDLALTVAAVLGTVCIVLVIVAAVLDIRIILFSTGSMSPTIPTGSAAIVRAIPAAEVRVGDVVTIDRPGRLPITHRVVAVQPMPGSPDARSIIMRGDANEVDDPAPYEVERVRLVVFAVPGIAPVLAAWGSPWVLGIVTIAATALVLAVFWPRRPRLEASPADPAADLAGAGERRRRRATAGGAAAGAVVLAIAAPALAPAPAHAAERTIQGDVIRLVSIDDPAMRSLAPGARAVWQVGVSADAGTPGTISIALSADGADAAGLRYRVERCATRWTGESCAGSDTVVAAADLPRHDDWAALGALRDDAEAWLRIEVALAPDAAPLAGPVELTVRATGAGDDLRTAPGGALGATGAPGPWPLLGAGALLAAAGWAMATGRRRRHA